MSGPGMFVSTKATEAAILAECPSPQAKLLLVLLAAVVDGKLQCFPSLATLCERSGIKSERTVQAHLQALVGAQLLRIEADEAPNGRRTSNVYTVLLPVEGATPAEPMERPRRRHPNSFKRNGRGVDKPVGKAARTPQILRGHPADIAGTVPADIAGLEPLPINKRREREASDAQAVVDNPVKGRRYAMPHPPVMRERVRLSDDEAAAGLRELAATLRGKSGNGIR